MTAQEQTVAFSWPGRRVGCVAGPLQARAGGACGARRHDEGAAHAEASGVAMVEAHEFDPSRIESLDVVFRGWFVDGLLFLRGRRPAVDRPAMHHPLH